MHSNFKKVLVVEDMLIAQKLAQYILEELNCSVDIASNANDAKVLVNRDTYDLIFLDIGLPDSNGIELAKIIRNTTTSNAKTPIIIVTATNELNYENEAAAAGVNEFIAKPLTNNICQLLLTKYSKKEIATYDKCT
ncbi:MAG: response regulator [Gammaproteobacteria bacterium]|nr:MAG: response regulator [Gammaproteobacteria bacterium]UTW43380.1 response regulator [bacterium SCSIO 12844]